ncbi:hypothetical protein GH733_001068 [Mirounga leonina]|nr:hypothetical protein GH733_001068 [Mirounga leonina]
MEAGSVVRAIFDFCPSVSEELPLFVGDVIEVLAVVDEFWLLGKKEDVTGDLVILDGAPTAGWLQGRSCWGARGCFPSSCVRELCLSSQSRCWCPQSTSLQIPEYSMGQARALMGLSAQLDEELDFREGDVITIIGVPEPGWFEGELEGRRGIFPEGFVELLGPLRTVDELVSSGNHDDCVINGEEEIPAGEDERGPEEDEEQPGTYGIALYRFQALEPNELDFEVGDKIRILGTLEDGWLEGSLKGRTGIFPYRFVKLFSKTRAEETMDPPQESSPTEIPDPSLGCSENFLVVEGRKPESPEYKAEKSNCVISETSASPLEHLTSEYEVNKNSHWDEGLSGGAPRSPGLGHEQPLAKDSSAEDPSEIVNGVSSQPQVPFPPRLQKHQYYSTAGGGHRSSEQYAGPLPFEARTKDNSSLPPRGMSSPPKTLQKPGLPPHGGSCLLGPRVVTPSQLSSLLQGVARCAIKHHMPKANVSSFCSAPEGSDMRPGLQDKVFAAEAMALLHGEGNTDLDSKLTQQLIEFEKSLSGPGLEPDKILRHFSIMDFNSEKDIVRGSSKLTSQQELPERRKALRPPPPRPCTPASASPHVLLDQNLKPEPPLTMRPSRPAPLPPSAQHRGTPGSPRLLTCTRLSCETPEKEGPESVDQTLDQTSQCPLVLVRVQEMEQDLDVGSRAQEELDLMLEEKQDESLREETLEDLEFYESNIESLNMELQQLRGIFICTFPISNLIPQFLNMLGDWMEKRFRKWSSCFSGMASIKESPWKEEVKRVSLCTPNMWETQEVREERETEKKGHWGSSWEYEDHRSLQKRDLTGLDRLYREGGLDSRHWTLGQNRPYRKRHCGYWAFEQSEPSYSDHEEEEESGKDCMNYRSMAQGCDGYKNSENAGSSPGTKDNRLTGSSEGWKAGGYGDMNGHTDGQNLNFDPEDSKETELCTRHSGLDDSVGNCGQPEKWHMDYRNFNYNLEDCKEANFYYRNRNNLCQVPGNYTNGQSVDFPDLDGVSEGKEFFKYHEGDRKVCENGKICPNAKTHALDQSDFDTEHKGYDTLFANCEYKFQNYRGTDSVHQMKNWEDNGIDKAGTMALGSRGVFPDSPQSQWMRGGRGEDHCGILQGPSLGKNTWQFEEDKKRNGLETWKRNSCFRRTAPSSLRRSEFVQNRKKTQVL